MSSSKAVTNQSPPKPPSGDSTAITTELPLPPQRPTQVRWLIFVLACFLSWLLYVHRYSWGVVKPYLKEEYPELTDTQLGWLDSLFQVTYALGQVPGGLAGDIFGPRMILSTAILTWSVAVAALAAATTIPQLAGIRVLFGLVQAPAYPCVSKVTRSWFPLAIRTTVQGMVASLSGRAGGACASLIVASFLMGIIELGWRESMLVLGAAGLLFALLFWVLFRNQPAEHPWANAAEQQEIDGPETMPPPAGRPSIRWSPANLLTLTAMLIYASASTFVDQFFVYWVPLFLVEGRGMTGPEMGLYASLPLFGGAIGGAAGGVLNDVMIRWTGSRRWGRSSVAFTGKFVAAILFALAIYAPDGRLAALTLLVCKFFCDWSQATVWGAVTDVSGRAAGTIFGLVNMAGAVAGFAANPLIGTLNESHGWEATFWFLAVVFLVAAAAWLFVDSNCRLLAEDNN